MVLAGGLSTRLYPLTKTVPKPLVPVAGEPNTAHVLRYLHSFGIDEIAMNVHYFAGAIEQAFGDGSRFGVRLHYLNEPALLGSAGAVKQMEGFFDDTFVVIGCDDLTDARLDHVVAFHRQRGAIATIGLIEAGDVTEYGVVILDERGKIVDFQEKPAKGTERSHLVNTGIYVFEPALLQRIPSGEFFDFGKNVFPALQQQGAPFYGMALPDAYWCDIGTPAEYRRATNDLLTGRLRLRGAPKAEGVSPLAIMRDGVHIEGPIHIGRGTDIGSGVRILGPSVLGNGVLVGDGAVVERSIIWDACVIGAGAVLRDSIVGASYDVAPGASVIDRVVANESQPAGN